MAAAGAGAQSAQQATVLVPGLRRRVRLFHVSDSHLDRGTDLGRESSNMNHGERMHQLYAGGQPDWQTGQVLLPSDALATQLATSQALCADAVVHTGNLVNFPSFRAVYHAEKLLSEAGGRYLFTAGNHVRSTVSWQ